MSTNTAEPEAPAGTGKRLYRVVKAEMLVAREEFQSLFVEHEAQRVRVTKHEAYRVDRAKFREAAVRAGTILADDDFNPAYAVPPRKTIDPVLQERFHNQHYIVADLEAEEASYSAVEKGKSFKAVAANA